MKCLGDTHLHLSAKLNEFQLPPTLLSRFLPADIFHVCVIEKSSSKVGLGALASFGCEEMEEYAIQWIALGLISWATAFVVIRKALKHRSFDFCNRVVSTIHAVIAVTLASLSVQDWSCPVCPLASTSSPKQMQTLAVSLSYLIYDLICCLFDNKINVDNTIHHLVSIVGIGAGLAYQRCGSEMVAAVWITEISSPFLHTRELLKEIGYKDTDLNLAADIAFAVIFSLARMVGGPYLAYVTLSANNPLIIKAMALGLQLVSAFWFYKILRMVKYKLVKRKASA